MTIYDITKGVGFTKKPLFYLFLLVIFFFKLLVNGYLTARIVMYNPAEFMGLRLGTIPLEDFLFGYSMIVLSLTVWEKAKE